MSILKVPQNVSIVWTSFIRTHMPSVDNFELASLDQLLDIRLLLISELIVISPEKGHIAYCISVLFV